MTREPAFIEIQNPAAQLESRPYGEGRIVEFKTIRNLVESRGHRIDLPGFIEIPCEG